MSDKLRKLNISDEPLSDKLRNINLGDVLVKNMLQ